MIKWRVLIDKLIWLCTLSLFCSFYIFNASTYSRFILLSITCLIAGLLLLRYYPHIRFYWHPFHTCIALFTGFCFFSYWWSIHQTATLVQTSVIFQLFICMSVLYLYFVRQTNTTPLIDVIIWGGIVVSLYTFLFYGIGNVKEIASSAGRLDNSFSNVNSIGMLMAVSATAIIYQLFFDKWKWSYLFIIPIVIVLAVAGSRTGLISFLFGACMVVFIRYSSKNWVLALFRYFVVALLLFVILRFLLELSIFEGINHRMETWFNSLTGQGQVDGSTRIRTQMIHIGLEQFKQSPFLGIGIGTSGELLASAMGWRTYLHNNYIELLACVGIIGTMLYYALFLVPAFQLFKQRKYHLPNTDLCLILIAVLLLMDYGTVSYYTKSHYFYIMLIFVQVQINKHYLKGNKNV